MPLLTDKIPRRGLEEILPMRSFWWLLESAPDGIMLVDAEGRIMLANIEAEKLFGYKEDELIDRPIEMVIPERFREKHALHRADYAVSPRSRPMGIGLELLGMHRDGTEFPVEISLSPVQTKQGLLVMAIIRDVSEYKREHFISETLQKALLSPAPEPVSGLTMAFAHLSAYEGALVGGDFYDVFAIRPGLTGIVIGDVSGKGVDAAVQTALAKYSLRAYTYEDPVPSSVLQSLNPVVCGEAATEGFITLFFGVLDMEARTFSYANAGHMPPLLLTHASHEVSELLGAGVPLGVIPHAAYEQATVHLSPGDRVLFYTDGVTDARDGKEFYGIDNLTEFFRTNGLESPHDFIPHLTSTLQDWSAGHLRDDIAVLLISME